SGTRFQSSRAAQPRHAKNRGGVSPRRCGIERGSFPRIPFYERGAQMTSEALSNDAVAGPAPHDASFAARNKLVITVLLVSTFVVMLNETAMTVAIPHLMEALNVPATAAQ